MKTTLALVTLSLLISSPALAGVWGATDQVPAATLVMPFFEVGIDAATNPHDTLPVVYNRSGVERTIHWEIWKHRRRKRVSTCSVTSPSPASAHGADRFATSSILKRQPETSHG